MICTPIGIGSSGTGTAATAFGGCALSRPSLRKSPTSGVGADSPRTATPKERTGRRYFNGRHLIGCLNDDGTPLLNPKQHVAGEPAHQVQLQERPFGRLGSLAPQIRQRRLKAVHGYFFTSAVVIGRLEQRITNVLKVDPAVHDSGLLQSSH